MLLVMQIISDKILEGNIRDCEYREVGAMGGSHGGWLIKHPYYLLTAERFKVVWGFKNKKHPYWYYTKMCHFSQLKVHENLHLSPNNNLKICVSTFSSIRFFFSDFEPYLKVTYSFMYFFCFDHFYCEISLIISSNNSWLKIYFISC